MCTDFERFMDMALGEAEKAGQGDEVPVGACLVDDAGKVLASTHNQTITLADPTAHAEILALRLAAGRIRNYRLPGTTLYVTIEPCPMCMGAIIHARIQRVVYGAADPKWGAAGSLYNLARDKRLNHQPEVIGGVRESACREMIQTFFRRKRTAAKANTAL